GWRSGRVCRLGRPIGPFGTDNERPGRGAIRRGEPCLMTARPKRSDAVREVLPLSGRQVAHALGQERCPDEETTAQAALDGDPIRLRTPVGQGHRLAAQWTCDEPAVARLWLDTPGGLSALRCLHQADHALPDRDALALGAPTMAGD